MMLGGFLIWKQYPFTLVCIANLHLAWLLACLPGLADPAALPQAVSAFQACHFIGMPECEVGSADQSAMV